MGGRIVLFGATGYTGELTARALVDRGARPLLAARSRERVEALAGDLGLEAGIADVSRPGTVRDLVGRGDVLVTTVGPFVRWGAVAAEAALDAGAHYLDSTGEPAFIRRVFEEYGARAAAAGCLVLTAFGFDWVPGNLAGALALEEAGPAATRVTIMYRPRGTGVSGGTAASMAGAVLAPSFAFRGGRLRAERTGARVRAVEGSGRLGLSVGGSEHLTLPALQPSLREVEVLVASGGRLVRGLPLATGALAILTRVPSLRAAADSVARRRLPGSTGGPTPAERAAGASTIVAEAHAPDGRRLARVVLDGPDGYTFTARMLAWGAQAVAEGRAEGSGALGPVRAFGLEALTAGAAEAGLRVR